MFLLDTNVISESRKLKNGMADRHVARWLSETEPAATYISLFTVHELEIGVLRMERRDAQQGKLLRRWLEGTVLPGFSERLLIPDLATARTCARFHVPDPASERDSWIAATALAHGLTIVTRNVRDFERTGAKVLNPWSER